MEKLLWKEIQLWLEEEDEEEQSLRYVGKEPIVCALGLDTKTIQTPEWRIDVLHTRTVQNVPQNQYILF